MHREGGRLKAGDGPQRSGMPMSERRSNGSTGGAPLPLNRPTGSPEVELPEKVCPYCGELMSRGSWVGTEPIYYHFGKCEPFRAALAAATARQVQAGLREARLRMSGVPDGPDLSGYQEQYGLTSENEDAWGECRKLLLGERSWVTVSGGYGTGKTTLAQALFRTVLLRKEPPLWRHLPSFQRQVWDDLKEGGTSEHVEALLGTPLLVLDDAGLEQPNPYWTTSVFYPVVMERWDRGLKTLMTTALGPEDFAERLRAEGRSRPGPLAWEPLLDRLRSTWVVLSGESRR